MPSYIIGGMFNQINSSQHPLVKRLVKLREDRDFRHSSQHVVVCGMNLIEELAPRVRFRSVLLEDEFHPGFELNAESIYRVPAPVIKKASGLVHPEPIVAEIDMPKAKDLDAANFLLILDGVSDPGNLGTLIRSACALAWDGVFLTPGSADLFNDKAIRAAKGATFTLPFKVGSYEELHALLKRRDMQLFAADARGNPVAGGFSAPLALALGNESRGLSPQLKEMAKMLAVPMSNEMDSLNVASAGAILMYAMKRS